MFLIIHILKKSFSIILLILYFHSLNYQAIKGQGLFSNAVFGVDLYSLVYFEALYFGALVLIKPLLIVDLFVIIDWIWVHWFWYFCLGVLECFYETPQKHTRGFASPAGSRKFVTRVLVRCSYLFTSIDCFDWFKIYFKFIVQDFLYWLLIFVFAFIVSSIIDTDNFPWVCWKIVYGPYPNQTYVFDPPTGLRDVVERMLVLWLHLSLTIDFISAR